MFSSILGYIELVRLLTKLMTHNVRVRLGILWISTEWILLSVKSLGKKKVGLKGE